MKCEWLKNEPNYFVTCKYFRLILQPLQTVIFVTTTFVTVSRGCRINRKYLQVTK